MEIDKGEATIIIITTILIMWMRKEEILIHMSLIIKTLWKDQSQNSRIKVKEKRNGMIKKLFWLTVMMNMLREITEVLSSD